jgi:hypothetical protein
MKNLLIGGPEDGKRVNTGELPILKVYCPHPNDDGSFTEEIYKAHRMRCGKNDHLVYVHESIEDDEVMQILIDNYPKAR